MALPRFDAARLSACTADIVAVTRELAARGFTPATSSNFSVRIDPDHVAITVSGRDKGRLAVEDIMVVDLDGQAVDSDHRPSAETLLHTQLYRHDAGIGCVLHTHSRAQTVASRLFATRGQVRLQGYELLKALAGHSSHEDIVELPVLPNDQDIAALARSVAPLLGGSARWAYLIEGHGLYVWGRDLPEARRHLEALEFLIGCELDLGGLRP